MANYKSVALHRGRESVQTIRAPESLVRWRSLQGRDWSSARALRMIDNWYDGALSQPVPLSCKTKARYRLTGYSESELGCRVSGLRSTSSPPGALLQQCQRMIYHSPNITSRGATNLLLSVLSEKSSRGGG